MTIKNIHINKIRLDEKLQNRVELNQVTVKEYSEAIDDGVKFPPVSVYFDGSDYWLVDGYHRYAANKNIGMLELECQITEGTYREAILVSVGVNAAHGLRRTNADKRKAIMTMLNDDEWNQWSDREIASQCAVDHKTVGSIRKNLTGEFPSEENSQDRKYTTKHGTEAVMSTKNIGKSKQIEDQEKSCNDKEREQIQQELYGEEEIDPYVEIENAHKEIERLTKIIESDDKLAEANREIKRLTALCDTMKSRIDSLMEEKGEAVRHAKMYKNKLENLEKQVKNADLVSF